MAGITEGSLVRTNQEHFRCTAPTLRVPYPGEQEEGPTDEHDNL